jgi:dTMP kinase
MHPFKGKFVVLEGIDLSGKGTHTIGLAKHFYTKSKQNIFLLTREPTMSTDEGKLLRHLLQTMEDPKAEAERLFQLYVADRKKHLANFVIPALKFGAIVFCDRFKHSTIAYQGALGVPVEKIIDAHSEMIVPDLTIIFDIAPEEYERKFAMQKSKGTHQEVFDRDSEFIAKVREIYLQMPKLLPQENIKIIDASRPFEEVHKEVIAEVEKILLPSTASST